VSRATLVPITPAVLGWAIRESGYSPEEVAERVGVSPDTLGSWLARTAQPDLTRFKKLVSVLKRPSATFLLPGPPTLVRPQVEFRHPPDSGRTLLNPVEQRYLREASRLQRALAWVLGELQEEPTPLPRAVVGSDVERLGAATRHLLGISDEQQLGWENSSQALGAWRLALENAAVVVLLLPLGKTSCRGFSLWDDRAPLIAVNTWWNNEARMYTLFHEYAHLLSRTNSACVEPSGPMRRQAEDPERWCEGFAAAVLMPWNVVSDYLRSSLGWSPGKALTELDAVRRVARRFKVSMRAAAIRLIERKIATWDLYREIPSWPDEKPPGGGGGGRQRHQIRLDAYGARTVRLFVRAVRREVLSRSDVTDYLDVGDLDLDKLEAAVNS